LAKKKLKLNIKNEQIAKAVNLKGLKDKLAKKKSPPEQESKGKPSPEKKPEAAEEKEQAPRIKARSKSAFAESEQAAPKEEKAKAPLKARPEPAKKPVEKEEEASKEEVKLGPTGKHISDILPKKEEKPEKAKEPQPKEKQPPKDEKGKQAEEQAASSKKKSKGTKFREFKSFQKVRPFDSRDRQGLRQPDDGSFRYRKKKPQKSKAVDEALTVRPSILKVRVPISIKDLAQQMKLKASQLIGELMKQGTLVTINDMLEDETTIQLLGQEFGCEISIDTSEEDRIKITNQSIQEEIQATESGVLIHRAPVVTFMGHVDHGKTSLIDYIRKSDLASGEAGAITQHIGAFRCHTKIGDIAILDTPGHEAFSAMRSRGANVTDIVVLVIAGDEGMRDQTVEALNHAKEAGVTIVVAINKCDKPNFNADTIYRQLSEQKLLPEAWGGQTITVNCSAVTGEGVETLLEMLALQAEVMELKANPSARARGTVLESEMHKGLGTVCTVLVQNGILKQGDAVVSDCYWGRVKTMRDEHGKVLEEAPPSTPIELTGMSGLPDAGEDFIVVNSEKEAREIADVRMQNVRMLSMQRKPVTLESMMEQAEADKIKEYPLIICADVQGSLEALKVALNKIKSNKIRLNIISSNVGEVSESIIQLAAASNATILGFHTQIESHAESLMKQLGVKIILHDVIYHAIDEVKELMRLSLDKIPIEKEKGKAYIKAVFKSSQLGNIAGCQASEGSIHRNDSIRVIRKGEKIWEGPIASLKRVKEDVREVQKGTECGIVLQGFDDFAVEDVLEAFEVNYIEQEL